MPKWLKFLIGLLLMPACLGALNALWRVARAGGHADTVWVAMLAGAACWGVIYLLLPRPMWIYVFGHELTHALWTWVFGGRVKRFKASSRGGHVIITRSNFVIALAPYFFPLYAVLLVLAFLLGHLIWNWRPYMVWFHLLLGAAYAFHITLTCQVLKTRQSDITEQGYVFSAAVIFLGNAIVLLLAIPLLSGSINIWRGFSMWFDATGGVVMRVVRMF